MKFIYLIPFLLPQVTSACGLALPTEMMDGQFWWDMAVIFLSYVVISGVIAGVLCGAWLVIAKLFPGNRGSAWNVLVQKFKTLLVVVTAVVFVVVFWVAYNILTSTTCLDMSDIPAGSIPVQYSNN